MYTKGESLVLMCDEEYLVLFQILDQEGTVICHVSRSEVDALLTHLNRN